MTYQRSQQAQTIDQLRARLKATIAELERTRHELREANRRTPTTTGNQATIQRRKPVAECGTYSGYARHHRNHQPVCDPCKTAYAIYQREYRARRNAA